ncbi:hypothetical protein PSTG_06863 [Puccinia striiformis f. sp. tritici PST-78]|uniref:Uncharacterized protein n=1 Tax=Puccinia striiformis f. sp. tritici PST-78 TaxID=1165861 RepID=A0A0L0VL57_9BASI|nr:hypothetical protein PSTG_06863 [Puccinia striiformis f. sp. tritici PST-78]
MADGSGAKSTVLGAPKFVEPQRVLGSIGVRAVALVGLIWFDHRPSNLCARPRSQLSVREVSEKSSSRSEESSFRPKKSVRGSGQPRSNDPLVDCNGVETAAEKHRFEMRW